MEFMESNNDKIRKNNPGNWRHKLQVSPEQSKYVANSTVLLARAYAFREYRSNALLIMNDEIPVGMALYYDDVETGSYDFSQIFIDERYQGRGYGLEAAKLILTSMEEDGKFDKVTLCFIEGNETAEKMYETLGFEPTGEADGDEIIMEKKLR